MSAVNQETLKPFLTKIVEGNHLTEEEAYKAMDCIMSGNATDAQMGSFLTGLRMNHETPEEITGFAKVMRAKAAIVPEETEAIDIVGTGGDLANSFNISTTSAFVIAAAGAKVAKHGNRSVSSKSGAADVLEALGAKIGLTPEESKKCLDEVGAAFLFAQTHHGSMKYAGPVRAQLGVRSVFNILGPLANPAMTNYIVLGVYEKELVRPMADVMKNLGVKRALIVYGDDGLDEISISSTTSVCEINGDEIKEYTIDPEELGLTLAKKEDIVGGTADENAVLEAEFPNLESQSVDYGIMEKADSIYTLPGNFGWDDVGSWLAVGRIKKNDDNSNVINGNVVAVNTRGCVIEGGEKLIATVGLRDIVVVDTKDATLITTKENAGEIKQVLAKLREEGKNEYL